MKPTYMKPIKITALALSLFLVACGGSEKSKKEQLKEKQEELKAKEAEVAKLASEVEKLRKEVGGTGEEEEIGTKTVVSTEMVPTTFTHGIDVMGKIDGDENVKIGGEMGGSVTKVYVKVGDKVSRGQLLAETDNATMMQGLQELKLQRNFAYTLFEKQERLWKQNIGSEVQYLSAKNNVDALDSRIATLNQQIAMSRIKSPINGTVDAVDIKPGQVIAPGMPVIGIVNKTNLKVKAEMAEAYINNVKKGNSAIVKVPDASLEFDTKIKYSGQQIDPLNRTFNVEMNIDKKHYDRLAPNMVAKISIIDYENKNALVLPSTVVQKDANGKYVLILVEEKGKYRAKKTPVETGMSYKGYVEITKGLSTGDKVITIGQTGLTDGEIVKIQK
ncbi:MAG TPA: efflux RND transporter periplasmic adaptor subunit [Flavobacteriales bacterium]|nr:efflux RND transporter periplasmic adaptor subunit [Flavobacteriales bacterium]